MAHLAVHMAGMTDDGPFTPANVLQIHAAKHGPPPLTTIPGYTVELVTYSLVNALLSGLRGTREPCPSTVGPRPQTFVWVPASILEYALPRLVAQYLAPETDLVSHLPFCLLCVYADIIDQE